MFLTKCVKSFQLIHCRQKCLNWCQIVVNRRHLSEDNNHNNSKDDKSIEKVVQKSDLIDGRRPEDKVIKAKQSLNQLIETLKSKEVLGESDDKLKELLAKPRFHVRRSARKEEDFGKDEEPINEISGSIDQRLVMAAKGIAKTFSGKESKNTENDLLRLLKLQVIETNLAKEGKMLSKEDLASLLGDMKVMKDEPSRDPSVRTYQPSERDRERGLGFDPSMKTKSFPMDDNFRRDGQKGRPFERRRREDEGWEGRNERFRGQQSITGSLLSQKTRDLGKRIDLFSGEGIGIFDANMKQSSESPKMLIWDQLMAEELESIVAQPPKNGFEEMIKWTEEGKLWKYPINNEQGLEEEESVPFYEHVLLDHLLEGFPERGPVRKFMELVIIGLSSNPYITVERKHRTVDYYREYFSQKEEMLKIAGAL